MSLEKTECLSATLNNFNYLGTKFYCGAKEDPWTIVHPIALTFSYTFLMFQRLVTRKTDYSSLVYNGAIRQGRANI